MTERTRERVKSDIPFDEGRDDLTDYKTTDMDVEPDVEISSMIPSNVGNVSTKLSPDGLAKARDFKAPLWLGRKMPISWSNVDMCNKSSRKPGRPCCLFAPIKFCKPDADTVNGFCNFHLRGLFNLTYQNDALYQLNAQGQAVLWMRAQCFVADPRPIDDRYTACFPIFELFENEPNLNEIHLDNLERYLKSIDMPNWREALKRHVVYLHRLMTIHSYFSKPTAQEPDEIDMDTKIILHWKNWNEHYSYILKKVPAEMYLFYVSHKADNSDEMMVISMDKCTTLTQMIVRMYSESHTSITDNRFLTSMANYGLWIRRYLAYADNMCSFGTIATPTVTTVGALATMTMVRTDACAKSTIYRAKGVVCNESFVVPSTIKHNNSGFDTSVVVSASDYNNNNIDDDNNNEE